MTPEPWPPPSVRALALVVLALLLSSTGVAIVRETRGDSSPQVIAGTTTSSSSTTSTAFSGTIGTEAPIVDSGLDSSTTTVAADTGTPTATSTTRARPVGGTTTPSTAAAPTGATADTTPGIYTVQPDGRDLRRIRNGGANFISWAPLGRRLAHGPRAEVLNADGTGVTPLVPGLLVAPPAWAPDGSRLALVIQNGSASDVVVIGADGSGARGLTTRGDVSGVSWSAGGTIAFLAGGRPFVINPDGSGLRQLVDTTSAYRAVAWSPDAKWLAFANATEIWVSNLQGSDVRPVGGTDGYVLKWADITWSPDSTRLAFQAGTGGASRARVVGYDGTDLRTFAENVMSPHWSTSASNRVAVFTAGKALSNGDRVSDLELTNPDRPGYRLRVVNDKAGANESSGPAYSADAQLLGFIIGGADTGGPTPPAG